MGSYARFEPYLTTLEVETCPEFCPCCPDASTRTRTRAREAAACVPFVFLTPFYPSLAISVSLFHGLTSILLVLPLLAPRWRSSRP